jgi:hypothetical protein
MSDERDPWERQGEDESNLWYDRFVLYLQMGPSRSLLGAENLEKDRKGQEKSDVSASGAWRKAANEWKWKERAEAWDEYRRKQVFTQGNAYDVTRVEKLNKYSEMIETEIDKMMTALAKRKKIAKPWFNHFMYEKYLQSLDALASETGGRVKTSKQEVTGKDGAPLEGPRIIFYLPENGDEEEGGA